MASPTCRPSNMVCLTTSRHHHLICTSFCFMHKSSHVQVHRKDNQQPFNLFRCLAWPDGTCRGFPGSHTQGCRNKFGSAALFAAGNFTPYWTWQGKRREERAQTDSSLKLCCLHSLAHPCSCFAGWEAGFAQKRSSPHATDTMETAPAQRFYWTDFHPALKVNRIISKIAIPEKNTSEKGMLAGY